MWPLERSTSKPFLLHIEGAGPVAGELDGMEFENLLASFDLHSIGLDQLSPIPVWEKEDVCHIVPSNYKPAGT